MEENFKGSEERIKKSQMNAEDVYDYQKLICPNPGLLDCTYEEEAEELIFTYDMEGKKPLEEIRKENMEKQYQLLINFAQLRKVCRKYRISFEPDNLYYDENLLLYARRRDIRRGGDESEEDKVFLESYQSVVCGLLNPRYTISQIQESGLAVMRGNRNLQVICEAEHVKDLVKILRDRKNAFLEEQRVGKRLVSRSGYLLLRLAAIVAAVGLTAAGAYAVYAGHWVIPKQNAVIEASQAYISNDYISCIDSARNLSLDDMNASTKYILAVSYANAESFKKEEIGNIVSRLAPSGNEKELEYWICLGRLDVEKAQDLALSLSDDKLLIYAYMKELDMLESNTSLGGEEKKTRMDKLEQEIIKLGDKYEEAEGKMRG